MKIEVWSDFACPISFVGNKTLKLAIDCFGEGKSIEIEYKSFQLESNPQHMTNKVMDVLQRKYQLSTTNRQKLHEDIVEQAKQIGLELNLAEIQYTNTSDAHRLVKFAEKTGKEVEMTDAIHHTCFLERKDISEKATLLSVAKKVGLDENEAEMLLSFNKYEKAVLADQCMATEMGIEGIPFLIFNNMYAVSGVQPLSVYLELLQDILKEDPVCFEIENLIRERTFCIGSECDRGEY